MHIERKSVADMAAMSLNELAELDHTYKTEIERLYADRASMRSVLHAKASEQGTTVKQVIETGKRKPVEITADPDTSIKA